MKKTVKTLMTAAVFAAAIGTIPSGTAENSSATDYNPVLDEWQGVYGPPPVTTTLAETTNLQTAYGTYTPVESETTAFNPEQMTTVAVYGPPIAWNTTTAPISETETTPVPTVPVPVYGPPTAWIGDLNDDNRVDVFDMVELRKAYVNYMNGSGSINFYRADINQDGVIGISDLVMLQNYILGNIKDFSNQIPESVSTEQQTSYANTTAATTAFVTSETEPVPAPVYGPPIAFE